MISLRAKWFKGLIITVKAAPILEFPIFSLMEFSPIAPHTDHRLNRALIIMRFIPTIWDLTNHIGVFKIFKVSLKEIPCIILVLFKLILHAQSTKIVLLVLLAHKIQFGFYIVEHSFGRANYNGFIMLYWPKRLCCLLLLFGIFVGVHMRIYMNYFFHLNTVENLRNGFDHQLNYDQGPHIVRLNRCFFFLFICID